MQKTKSILGFLIYIMMLSVLPMQCMENTDNLHKQLVSTSKEDHADSNNFSMVPREVVLNIFSCLAGKAPEYPPPVELMDTIRHHAHLMENFNADFNISEELKLCYDFIPYVMSYGQKGHKKAEDDAQQLVDTIKTFLRMRITCKEFNTLLTIKNISELLKNNKLLFKNGALYCITRELSDTNYTLYRVPILILIFAGAYGKVYQEYSFVRYAVENNDIELINELFIRGMDPNENLNPRLTSPFFFYARTTDMVQLFLDNGVNVHSVTPRDGTNVLWHIVGARYPADLMALYLSYDVDARQRHPVDRSCLLHAFIESSGDNIDDYFKKGKLLLDAIPDMVNTVNTDGQTPLDILYQQLDDEELYEVFLTQVPFYVEFKNKGGMRLKKIENSQETEECRCVLF